MPCLRAIFRKVLYVSFKFSGGKKKTNTLVRRLCPLYGTDPWYHSIGTVRGTLSVPEVLDKENSVTRPTYDYGTPLALLLYNMSNVLSGNGREDSRSDQETEAKHGGC